MVKTFVMVKRKDRDGIFAQGTFVKLTKDRIYVRDNETGEVHWYDRDVFYVEKPFKGFDY